MELVTPEGGKLALLGDGRRSSPEMQIGEDRLARDGGRRVEVWGIEGFMDPPHLRFLGYGDPPFYL